MIEKIRVVLIRGLAREAGHWGEFTHALKNEINHDLADQNITIEILTPDLLGCGVNFKDDATRRIGDYADHLVENFLKNETVESFQTIPTFLVGISMGGMVVLDLMQRYDEYFCGAVLINSSTGDQAIYKRLRPRAWLPALISILAPMAIRERVMLGVVSNDKSSFDKNLNHWVSIQKARPVTRRTILFQLLAAARYRLRLNRTNNVKPGAVFASRKDNMVSYRCSEDLASRLAWPIELHESAGHDLPLDDASWLAQKISKFIVSCYRQN